MIDNEIRTHLESLTNKEWGIGPGMPIEQALELGIHALMNWGGDENTVAARVLMMIHDQRGCEHLDTGGNPDNAGKLTQAISVIIFG